MGGYELRPLGVAGVIGRATRLYTRNAVAIWHVVVPIVVVTELLYAVINLSAVPAGSEAVNGRLLVPFGSNIAAYNGAVTVEGLFIPFVVYPIVFAFLLRVLSQAYLGEPLDPNAALAFGVRRLPGMIWIGLLYALAVTLGLILFVFPGIYVAVAFFLGYAEYVVEGDSGTSALRRSQELVEGRWLQTFAALVIYAAIAALATFGLPVALRALEQGTSQSATTYIVLLRLVDGLGWALTVPFGAAVATTIYFDLRVRKEGFDTRALGEHLGITPFHSGTGEPAPAGDQATRFPDWTSPATGDAPPGAAATPPAAGDAPPGAAATPPAWGEAPPACGEAPPAGGEPPPAADHAPPAAGEPPPVAGETPPAADHAPPAAGEAPPPPAEPPPATGLPPGDDPFAMGNY